MLTMVVVTKTASAEAMMVLVEVMMVLVEVMMVLAEVMARQHLSVSFCKPLQC